MSGAGKLSGMEEKRIISIRQARGKEQLSFDVMFCVHWALLCKYQLTQIPK